MVTPKPGYSISTWLDPNSAEAADDDGGSSGGGGQTLISPPDPHPIAPRDKMLPLGKPSLSIEYMLYYMFILNIIC